jgi:hypothetical protein
MMASTKRPNFAKIPKSDIKSPGAGWREGQHKARLAKIHAPNPTFNPPAPLSLHLRHPLRHSFTSIPPCDDEVVAHFVHQGHAINGNMSNVSGTCAAPEKVLKEGGEDAEEQVHGLGSYSGAL